MAQGGLAAFPTDTVYGIGTAYNSKLGIGRIYALKGRAMEKAIPILISSLGQLDQLAQRVPDAALALAERFWPGALTIVLVRNDSVLPEIAPDRDTVGIRMPGHPYTLELIAKTGAPVACSSANRSGQSPALTAAAVAGQCPEGLEIILDGGPSTIGKPSTVVDFTAGGAPRVLRDGAISRQALADVIGALRD
jgi:L-threonylcarbamoyladenylate synthase